MSNQVPMTTFPDEALKRTVQAFPKETVPDDVHIYTYNLWNTANQMPEWGTYVYDRDARLRNFWPTEPYLAGTLFSIAAERAAYNWTIESTSSRIEDILTDMLHGVLVNQTFGWEQFILALATDLLSQDNGAFIEIIRDPTMGAGSPFKRERAPVVGLAHLDSSRCQRTGNPMYPVVYFDRYQKRHKMPWYNIISLSDMPSPKEIMNGVGVCAVSRVLRMAQIMYSIEVFKDEKIGGRQYKQVHFVSGVGKLEIEDVKRRGQEEADSKGQLRYIEPAIIASLDPEKPVTTATIDLAALPDNFDLDAEMRWYISGLALGMGVDYQDLAPLASGNMGSSQQSEILHRKSRGKGPALFMRMLESAFKYYGVFPKGTSFSFVEKDLAEQLQDAELDKANMEMISIARRSSVIDGTRARKIAVTRGIFTEEELSGIPEDFGNDAFQKQNQDNNQMLGATGANTVGEDAGRTQKGFFERLFGRSDA